MSNSIVNDILKNSELKIKEARFVDEFARSDNKSAAARVAGIHINTASLWLKREDILKQLRRARTAIANASVDSDFLIGRVNLIARSSVADYFDDDGNFVGFSNLTEEQKLCIKSFSQKRDGNGFREVKVELFDVMKATEMLGKPSKLFDYDDEDFDGLTEEELDAELADMDARLHGEG